MRERVRLYARRSTHGTRKVGQVVVQRSVFDPRDRKYIHLFDEHTIHTHEWYMHMHIYIYIYGIFVHM